ncbi:hypothetical protein CALCODRAFT_243251 [Calocera cornea HHB12733]|uniref:Uncharacterized protein n=1 Tax=Calocera cornea HHB12733 TaxID=1353952 RepID=A0A165GQ89_9BASI|nr:hypothetical protein CALCODRAFT_243251 [Calocera cornea HHB12733]
MISNNEHFTAFASASALPHSHSHSRIFSILITRIPNMKLTTLSITAMALISGALATPNVNWKRQGPGPSGTLQQPAGGADWDNTGGFGLGHVVYQGVDQPYTNAQGVTHVKTHHIDLYLQAADGSGTQFLLAEGIAPNSNNVVDEQFQIPVAYGGPVGDYRLIVEETQYGTTPGQPIAITFRSAAPLISITAGAN